MFLHIRGGVIRSGRVVLGVSLGFVLCCRSVVSNEMGYMWDKMRHGLLGDDGDL